MRKDFKVGMMVGLVPLLAAVVWLSTYEGIGTQARLEKAHARLVAQQQRPQTAVAPKSFDPEPNAPRHPQPPAPPLQAPPQRSVTAEDEILSPPKDERIETRQKIVTNRLHIVRSGDTLSGIAQTYLGSSRQWPRLLELNRDVLTHPDKIRPGMKIVVPPEATETELR